MANPVPSIENDASLTRSGDSRIKPLAGKHPLVTKVDNHKHQGGFPALHLMTGPNVSRSEEHTSELQSLMRISYAVFCLKKKNTKKRQKISYSITCNQCNSNE